MTRVRLLLIAVLGVFAIAANAETAPDFTLESDTGEKIRLKDQRGKVVMINFWASWCAPCRKEMPLLNELYERHQEAGFTLLGVNVEHNPDAAEQFLEEVDVSFPILYDRTSEVSRRYQVTAMPTTVMVDRKGEVRYVNRGYKEGDDDKYRRQLRELIRE